MRGGEYVICIVDDGSDGEDAGCGGGVIRYLILRGVRGWKLGGFWKVWNCWKE